MKIKWVRLALTDLDEAAAFISQDNPEAAIRTVKRIREATRILSDQPELVIVGTPFILPYRVIKNTVQILRVLHGARKWPQRF